MKAIFAFARKIWPGPGSPLTFAAGPTKDCFDFRPLDEVFPHEGVREAGPEYQWSRLRNWMPYYNPIPTTSTGPSRIPLSWRLDC